MPELKKWIAEITSTKSKKNQALIDESSEASFPASDAPSWTSGEAMKIPHVETNDIFLSQDFSQQIKQILKVNGIEYHYYSLSEAEKSGLKKLSRLPFTLKILLENLLRHLDGKTVTLDDIKAVIAWLKNKESDREIAYRPARVLMQDFTGVPAVVDLAARKIKRGHYSNGFSFVCHTSAPSKRCGR
jgi:aconitate hydratase